MVEGLVERVLLTGVPNLCAGGHQESDCTLN